MHASVHMHQPIDHQPVRWRVYVSLKQELQNKKRDQETSTGLRDAAGAYSVPALRKPGQA